MFCNLDLVLYRSSIEFLLEEVSPWGKVANLRQILRARFQEAWSGRSWGGKRWEQRLLFASGTASLTTAHTFARLMHSHVLEAYCSHAGAPIFTLPCAHRTHASIDYQDSANRLAALISMFYGLAIRASRASLNTDCSTDLPQRVGKCIA